MSFRGPNAERNRARCRAIAARPPVCRTLILEEGATHVITEARGYTFFDRIMIGPGAKLVDAFSIKAKEQK